MKTREEEYSYIVITLGNNNSGKKDMFSFDIITGWSNIKYKISVEGKVVTPYQDFFMFTVNKICQYFGLYIFHGLSLYTMLEMKSRTKYLDKGHGNDFIQR